MKTPPRTRLAQISTHQHRRGLRKHVLLPCALVAGLERFPAKLIRQTGKPLKFFMYLAIFGDRSLYSEPPQEEEEHDKGGHEDHDQVERGLELLPVPATP
jgi:hypothetical protein